NYLSILQGQSVDWFGLSNLKFGSKPNRLGIPAYKYKTSSADKISYVYEIVSVAEEQKICKKVL
ncbi:hypothetical protein MTR67_046092, partial [Solanum verrucosum]